MRAQGTSLADARCERESGLVPGIVRAKKSPAVWSGNALPVRAAKMCRLSEEDPAVRLPGLSQPSRESTAASAFSRSSLRVYIAVVAMAPASTARSSAKPAAGMMSGTASMGRMK